VVAVAGVNGCTSCEQAIQAAESSVQNRGVLEPLSDPEAPQSTEQPRSLADQLIEAQTQIASSRNRQKEMARVIAGRDAKIADCEAKIANLREELQGRYEELATLQRFVLRSRPLGGAKKLSIPHIASFARKLFAGGRK
jgi:septal ring factor EnvC (AmiA/AmiB activator)